MPDRRHFLTIAAAASAAFCVPPAFAVNSLVDVELVDRSANQVLPVYPYRGSNWLAGRPGNRYAVRLRNRSGARVLAVLSIDGVNAVSGETAAVGQTGYVLGPYQSTEIAGWRKSLTESAAFYFTALPDSYAARTDRPDNVGVIGVAVFREKMPERAREAYRSPTPIPPPPGSLGEIESEPAPDLTLDGAAAKRARPSAAAPANESKAAGSARDERLGTGHGERVYAPTTETTFERAGERPNEVVRLRYDSRERLIALGVIPPRQQPAAPEPFPRFAPDPKG